MADRKDQHIAMLIDADNVSYKKIEDILKEVNRYGTPTIKRIYGDWTNPFVENWKSSLLTHAITPIQQYSYTQGKNSSDSALIIDAMDILHSDRVDGFCIVSSDSDFTRLATRLRESGKLVIGIGERKTPKPFIASCDKFIYVEILEQKSKSNKKNSETNPPPQNGVNNTNKPTPKPAVKEISSLDEDILLLLKDTVDDTADESGWAFLGEIGNLLIKRMPDFDARNYGFEKISHLFKSRKKDFEVDERTNEKSRNKLYYVRNILTNESQQPEQKTTDVERPKDTKPTKEAKSEKVTKEITETKEVSEVKAIEHSANEQLQFTVPSPGNKITADDVRKNQIRITKDLKPFFPTRSQKITIKIEDEFECSFSHHGHRSHTVNLGKAAAMQLGLAEGVQLQITKVDENTFTFVKKA
ncbi:NYN domain-containing protein [Sphingobacterium corticis]|uniref:NYN domain-containing protein n=1 Tax=Sphingobacterium corticis TaxID=1812823 RepID=A0ABW5NPQ3_9SPHI